jgi:hypothetical protein
MSLTSFLGRPLIASGHCRDGLFTPEKKHGEPMAWLELHQEHQGKPNRKKALVMF